MRKASLGLALVFIVAAAAPAETERSISVTGTAVIQVVPDFVAWNVSIVDTNAALLVAKHQNDGRISAAMELIKSLGTQPVDVQTSNVSIHKEYNHDEQGRQTTFKHYVVSRTISVKQRDVNRFDEFFDALVEETGADVNFNWQSSRIYDLRKDARTSAVQIAKQKAESMLSELGAKLGPVITVEEDSGRSLTSSISNVAYSAEAPKPDDEITGTFAPGAIDVRVSVNVKFGIAE
ncbi:MAG: SIMPL domain-containing protein [Candidatus Hydrogenedentes bacterium]|nr:SIMPL domain-containing protein [Candidatus Hydrogenedentota bacterium]